MEHPGKRIYILIGPKGSGKTYIGTLLQDQLHIPFLRVEDIALRVKKDRNYTDAGYIQEVFQGIETAVRETLVTENALVFESTGLTEAFDQMLLRLQRDFQVTLIRIKTASDACLSRVRSRDQSIHINVSDDHVRAINAQVMDKVFAFDGEIDNTEASAEDILHTFKKIVETKDIYLQKSAGKT